MKIIRKKKKINIINSIKHFPGLSSNELEDATLRTLRAKQLLRIRRISNWSKSTDEMLRVTISEEITIENTLNSIGNDFKDTLQQLLEDSHDETRQKITIEIAKRFIAEYQQ